MDDVALRKAPILFYGPGATEPDILVGEGDRNFVIVDNRVPGQAKVTIRQAAVMEPGDLQVLLAEATTGGASLGSALSVLYAVAKAAGLPLTVILGESETPC